MDNDPVTIERLADEAHDAALEAKAQYEQARDEFLRLEAARICLRFG